jgi:hypothetical protein
MKNIFTEPLLHFLLLGVGLFVLFEFIAGDEESYDENVIVVDKETLLTFVQFRARAFERGGAAEYLDQLEGEELERLIGDYVREEALYRQAVALGVDDNDYVIKRRMIQSIEFITNGFVTAAMDLSEEDIETFFEANKNDYFIAPYMTFTHVYFEKDKRGDDAALALAEAKLTELNAARVSFAEAPRHGDRFPYFLNYVERDPDFVASGSRATFYARAGSGTLAGAFGVALRLPPGPVDEESRGPLPRPRRGSGACAQRFGAGRDRHDAGQSDSGDRRYL